jgi:hypothetical protein
VKKIIYDNDMLPMNVIFGKAVNNAIYKYAVYCGVSAGSIKNGSLFWLNKQRYVRFKVFTADHEE